ncbi:hypothetical protein [Rothia dentocariosa]|uniref:hypothetical protein n=1 Tax=Rothia dentocariosa TaxID=2047 RepID=UPI0036F21F99
MLLEVMLDNRTWIVDAGFGGLCPSAPPRRPEYAEHRIRRPPHHTPRDGRYIVSTRIDGEQRMLYNF